MFRLLLQIAYIYIISAAGTRLRRNSCATHNTSTDTLNYTPVTHTGGWAQCAAMCVEGCVGIAVRTCHQDVSTHCAILERPEDVPDAMSCEDAASDVVVYLNVDLGVSSWSPSGKSLTTSSLSTPATGSKLEPVYPSFTGRIRI